MIGLPEGEIPQFRTTSQQRRKKLHSPHAYADFRIGIDIVVRRGDRCFIVDTWCQYADVEVQSDTLSAEDSAWYRSLTGRHRAGMAYATWYTCLLSLEGKAERLEAMGIGWKFEAINDPWEDEPESGWQRD